MDWILPTTADISRAMTGPERQACSEAALDEVAAQPDPLPDTLADAVNLVRQAIMSSTAPRYTLGAEGTVPKGLLSTVQDIAAYKCLSRLPVPVLITDSRTQLYRDAIARLHDIEAGKLKLENPLTGTVPSNTGASVVHSTRLRFTRRQTSQL